MIRVLRVLRVLRMFAPSITAIVVAVVAAIVAVIPVVPVVAGTIASVAHVGGRNDAQATQITARHAATPVVVDWALAFARDEAFAARPVRSPLLKDEAWLRAIGPHEHDAAAAVIEILLVRGFAVHEHAQANARSVVRIQLLL